MKSKASIPNRWMPFLRVKLPKQAKKAGVLQGSGLGLAIAKEIVQREQSQAVEKVSTAIFIFIYFNTTPR